MSCYSHIIITNALEEAVEQVKKGPCKELEQILFVNDEKFLVEDTKAVIEKAYVASSNQEVLVLVSHHFSEIAQNRLLKIIEEPPPKKHFVLITSSKASLSSMSTL